MTYDSVTASLYKYAHDKYGDKFDTLPKSRKHYILMEELMRQLRSDEPSKPDTKEMRKSKKKSFWEKILDSVNESSGTEKSKLPKDSSLKNNMEFKEIEKIEPLDVLKMRLAQGEISLEEFNKIKQHLE
jgi:hypothetical protein